MTDSRGDLPDDLRRALKTAPARSARTTDDLLARVHVGARRRRTRRTVTVGVVGLAAAAAVFAVAAPLSDWNTDSPAAAPSSEEAEETDDDTTSTTLAAPPEPGRPTKPTDVRVRSVSATAPEELWVLGDARCPHGDCLVVGHTDDAPNAPLEFTTAPGSASSEDTLRMADNGEDGWVLTDERLYTTHDGARSWTAATVPMESVDDVVVSESSVWAIGGSGEEQDGRIAVATAPLGEDELSDAELPPELSGPGTLSEVVMTDGEEGRRFGFLSGGAGAPQFVAAQESDQSWQAHETEECGYTYSLSASSTSLWAMCGVGSRYVPMVSVDGGETWELVEVDQTLTDASRIAAIDEDTAFLSTGIELYVLEDGQLRIADAPTDGARSKAYDAMGFVDEQTGFIVDSDGVLSRTDSGGSSWEPVELP